MQQPFVILCPSCLAKNRLPHDSVSKAHCGKCKQSLLEGKVIETDQVGLERIKANSDLPVLVDFYATWCGPCKMLTPVFTKVAMSYALKVQFVKVDSERNQQASAAAGIRGVPTLIMYQKSVELNRVSGAPGEGDLRNWIDSVIRSV